MMQIAKTWAGKSSQVGTGFVLFVGRSDQFPGSRFREGKTFNWPPIFVTV